MDAGFVTEWLNLTLRWAQIRLRHDGVEAVDGRPLGRGQQGRQEDLFDEIVFRCLIQVGNEPVAPF
jgi:hypothetical protein